MADLGPGPAPDLSLAQQRALLVTDDLASVVALPRSPGSAWAPRYPPHPPSCVPTGPDIACASRLFRPGQTSYP